MPLVLSSFAPLLWGRRLGFQEDYKGCCELLFSLSDKGWSTTILCHLSLSIFLPMAVMITVNFSYAMSKCSQTKQRIALDDQVTTWAIDCVTPHNTRRTPSTELCLCRLTVYTSDDAVNKLWYLQSSSPTRSPVNSSRSKFPEGLIVGRGHKETTKKSREAFTVYSFRYWTGKKTKGREADTELPPAALERCDSFVDLLYFFGDEKTRIRYRSKEKSAIQTPPLSLTDSN